MKLYSIREITERLGVCRGTVVKLIDTGALAVVRIGRRVMISDVELERFISSGGVC